MSQSQVAEAVEMHRSSVLRFVASERSEGRNSNTFQCCKIPIQKDWHGQGNNQDIKAIPIDIATKFWADQSQKGNLSAIALCLVNE